MQWFKEMSDEELTNKYNSAYLEIIMRYRDYIEEKETLYVAELPKLITPNDEAVLSAVKNITNMFMSYRPEEDFYAAAKEAHSYVKNKIRTISLPVQFWPRPSQTIGLEAGDVFDKAVLLCSMMIAMGNISTRVITAVKDSEQKFAVYCECKDKLLFFEVEKEMCEFQNREEMLEKLGVGKDAEMTAYEFNDKMYNNLA